MDKIGKYRILESLGQGSMGFVYKALDPDIDRTVAIKVVHFGATGLTPDEENLRLRFIQEAKAAGRLSHQNIIAIYDTGRENDNLYIVMQYVEGKNLQNLLSAGKTFTPLEALNIVMPICRALDYAHQNGVIHRDIKPGNIILDRKGQPYLADFGVAKLAQANLTRSGLVFGTPGYISPEQFMGEKIDGRSDLFSLGVLLYVLLTGKEPFAQRGMELTTVMKKILTQVPEPPSKIKADVPRGFDAILNKALAKRPEKRYQSGQEMAMALETMFEEACSTLLVRLDERLKPATRSKSEGRRFVRAAFFITIIVLMALAAFMFLPRLLKVQATLTQPEKDSAEVQNHPAERPKVNTSPKAVEKPADKPASGQTEGQVASNKLKVPANIGPTGTQASSSQVGGSSPDSQAQSTVPVKPQSGSERSQGQMKKELQKQAELGKKIAAGADLYNRGNFAGCLKVMEEVLAGDGQNSEARRYRYLAATALARQDVLNILERQRLAEEEKDLSSFLQDFGPDELVRQKRDEALLLFNYYDQILSVHSNISLDLLSATKAEVRFGRLLTAVYKKTGERKVLADSLQVWTLEKKGQEWKVTQVRGQ